MKQIIQIFFGRWESDFKCYNKCFLICARNIACQKLYSEFARFIWWSFAASLWLIYSTIVISCDTFPVVLTNLFYNCYLMWHFSGGVAISFSYNSREMFLFPEETVYIPLQQILRKNHCFEGLLLWSQFFFFTVSFCCCVYSVHLTFEKIHIATWKLNLPIMIAKFEQISWIKSSSFHMGNFPCIMHFIYHPRSSCLKKF